MIELSTFDKQQLNDFSGFLRFIFTWPFLKLLNTPEKFILLITGNQFGKCFEENQVLTALTGLKPAGEVKAGDELLSGVVTSNRIFEDDIYEVTFQTGHKIRVNKEHPIWWRDRKQNSVHSDCWMPVGELISRTRKGYAYFSPASEHSLVSDVLKAPKLLGYLCSDGHISTGVQSLKFTNNRIEFLDEVESLTKKYFSDIECNRRAKNKGFDLFLIRPDRQPNTLRKYLNELAISRDSFGGIVRGDKTSLAEFVRGFFNGDGYLLIRQRKSGYGTLPHVEVGFCIGGSKQKAEEFQYILWKLGIMSYVCHERMRNTTQEFYRVKVNSFDVPTVLGILDTTKYPDKFVEARRILEQNPYPRSKNKEWISIKKIEYVGRGKVAGITTTTGELFSYGGLKTHNTDSVAMSYVLRVLGYHPQVKKNVVYFECDEGHCWHPHKAIKWERCPTCGHALSLHERNSRTFRFASEKLPGQNKNTSDDGKSAEVKNTVYPAFKRRLPPSLLKSDITARNTDMIIRDPYGGDDIIVEYVSYNMSTQSVAGQQRMSTWEDEAPPQDFHEEQPPRLLAEDGDLVLTYTPVDRASWLFDDLYDKASVYYRTQAIVDFMKSQYNQTVHRVEHRQNGEGVAVIQAATDDNPTLKSSVIEELCSKYGDADTIAIRRYGIFRQLSGRIFKGFDYSTHVIRAEEYFPTGIPHEWVHARGIDYHPQTDWHCGMASLSPDNEMFIWGELLMSPERYTTIEIAHELALRSKDYKFRLNLIDPLAEATRKDTVTVLTDLNNAFSRLKKDGVGVGGYWSTWDTKGERGREQLIERIKNSTLCKRPGNNKIMRNGVQVCLPTIWILDSCKATAHYMKNWRWEEWADSRSASLKDKKNTPEQKWSHLNMVWEAVLKEEAWRPPRLLYSQESGRNYGANYFQGSK